MTLQHPCYNKEEFVRRGQEIYHSQVRQQVEKDNHGKIVVIDIKTGAFELAKDILTVSKSTFNPIDRCSNLVRKNRTSSSSSSRFDWGKFISMINQLYACFCTIFSLNSRKVGQYWINY